MKLLKLGTFSIHYTYSWKKFYRIFTYWFHLHTAVLFFGSHMYIIYESPLTEVKNHGVILSFHWRSLVLLVITVANRFINYLNKDQDTLATYYSAELMDYVFNK